ncbi:hypothetical protein GOBAR_AA01229 [Gossypium barbadense]|uniref:Uncharacterized protein n=1 Tax=Gossypium barbadense TaxID=3634 RepID=A0A2P5YUW8_GOSBA|nr:hypothetical protein GOBAR_AA01229 [Gossypium barbadense]
MSETHFQNTETALKNQQALIQGLETQIGQLAKLISERPQGSLPSNTKSNPREQLNEITIQYEEGLVVLEPEPRQEIVETSSENTPEPCSSWRQSTTRCSRPSFTTSEPNRAIPLTVLSILPYGTIEKNDLMVFLLPCSPNGEMEWAAFMYEQNFGKPRDCLVRPMDAMKLPKGVSWRNRALRKLQGPPQHRFCLHGTWKAA